MKKWTNPAFIEINISETASGGKENRYEGQGGVNSSFNGAPYHPHGDLHDDVVSGSTNADTIINDLVNSES